MTIPPNGNVCTRHESGSISPVQALVDMILLVFKRFHPKSCIPGLLQPRQKPGGDHQGLHHQEHRKSGTFKTAKEQREAGQILCFPNHSVPEDRLPTAPASLRTFHLCFGTKTKSNLSKQFFLENKQGLGNRQDTESLVERTLHCNFFVRSSHPARFALA